LCASAHNFAPVRSVYRWRGDIYERTEGRVSLHTRCDRVAEIVALAKQEHPYEVPGISTRAITDGNPDYARPARAVRRGFTAGALERALWLANCSGERCRLQRRTLLRYSLSAGPGRVRYGRTA
jgi:uncharacterized protein involved in tolerance to divalent cations